MYASTFLLIYASNIRVTILWYVDHAFFRPKTSPDSDNCLWEFRRQSFLGQTTLEVSDDIPEKHSRSSFEDVQPSHPPIGQSEEQGKGSLGKLYSNPWNLHTRTPLLVFLLHHYSINEPFRIKDFLDCPNLLKFIHLFLYCLDVLFLRASGWLSPWYNTRIYI